MALSQKEISRIIAHNTPEEAARLIAQGGETPDADPGTLRRRAQRSARVFPVVSRSGRTYTQSDGRAYGEVDKSAQRQADAGYWRVGDAVRRDCEPLVVAVGGKVERIYEVYGWRQSVEGKWVADLGPELTDADLGANYPDFPYRLGDACPTRRGGAYRPETY